MWFSHCEIVQIYQGWPSPFTLRAEGITQATPLPPFATMIVFAVPRNRHGCLDQRATTPAEGISEGSWG